MYNVDMHTQEFSEAEEVESVKSRDLSFNSDWLNDVIISLRDHARRDCWHWQRENQSLWFCWAFSSFLFFSRLILSGSLLYFTGKQSRHFLLIKPFPVFKIYIFFIYLSWLTLCFLYAQVRVFAVWHLVHAVLFRLRTKGKNCSIHVLYSECKMSCNLNLLLVLVVCIRAQGPIRLALISVFSSMKRLRVFILPLDGMLIYRGVTPDIKFADTHWYTWVERGTVRVKCLAQEHNTMSPARARTRTMRLLRLQYSVLYWIL